MHSESYDREGGKDTFGPSICSMDHSTKEMLTRMSMQAKSWQEILLGPCISEEEDSRAIT